jgi:hypothetical protein
VTASIGVRAVTLGMLAVYAVCWRLGLIAWWMVLVYSMVVTVAWAETGNREPLDA